MVDISGIYSAGFESFFVEIYGECCRFELHRLDLCFMVRNAALICLLLDICSVVAWSKIE